MWTRAPNGIRDCAEEKEAQTTSTPESCRWRSDRHLAQSTRAEGQGHLNVSKKKWNLSVSLRFIIRTTSVFEIQRFGAGDVEAGRRSRRASRLKGPCGSRRKPEQMFCTVTLEFFHPTAHVWRSGDVSRGAERISIIKHEYSSRYRP